MSSAGTSIFDLAPQDDSNERWISYSEFCRNYRMVTIFHSQTSFKNVKTIQHVYDPTGVKDHCKIPQVVCKLDYD
jgi:hypothetical protein